MKDLNAVKCKDGWLVTISNQLTVNKREDVFTLAELLGLMFKEEFSNDKKIYAEQGELVNY